MDAPSSSRVAASGLMSMSVAERVLGQNMPSQFAISPTTARRRRGSLHGDCLLPGRVFMVASQVHYYLDRFFPLIRWMHRTKAESTRELAQTGVHAFAQDQQAQTRRCHQGPHSRKRNVTLVDLRFCDSILDQCHYKCLGFGSDVSAIRQPHTAQVSDRQDAGPDTERFSA